MAPTPAEVLALAALLSTKIKDRRPEVARHVSFYKGTEGRMRFASDEFRDYFERRFSGFSDNWCMPVAQAPIERISPLGIRLEGQDTADLDVARRWERNDGNRGLSEALMMMTIAKRSFGLVSPTPNGARYTLRIPTPRLWSTTRSRASGAPAWLCGRTIRPSTGR